MSTAAYLVCHRDRTLLGLGKPLRPPSGLIRAFSFHQSRFRDALFDRSLWEYLADHPGDDLVLHFDSDPGFDDVAGYREIGGDVEDGDVPFRDHLAGRPDEPTVHYAVPDPGPPRSVPGGLVRRRGAATPVDEALSPDLRWEPTELLRRTAPHDTGLVEIPANEAVGIVLQLIAARRRPGPPGDDRNRVNAPRPG